MNKHIQNSRRDFIRKSAASVAFLALGFSSKTQAEGSKAISKVANLAIEMNPYILINELGQVTLFNARPDMGQGTFQAIPMLIAEELEVPLSSVNVVMSDGSAKFGSQLSGGSSSVRTRWIPMRTVGAAAKEMLIQVAAKKWNINTDDCFAKDARVYSKKSNASFSYGELVEEASHLPVPTKPKLKSVNEFTQIGKSLPRTDIPSKVNGTAIFGMDVKLPGMLYAAILRAILLYH